MVSVASPYPRSLVQLLPGAIAVFLCNRDPEIETTVRGLNRFLLAMPVQHAKTPKAGSSGRQSPAKKVMWEPTPWLSQLPGWTQLDTRKRPAQVPARLPAEVAPPASRSKEVGKWKGGVWCAGGREREREMVPEGAI